MAKLKLPEIAANSLQFIDDRVQDIVDTINEAFIVRTSVLDPSKFSIESRDKNRYRSEPTFDTLYLYLKGIGKSISRTDLRILLSDPNYFDQENPILNYLDSIRGTYKGESHIDKLCEHITPRVFDREPDYYRERMNAYIRKWMYACIAQWKDNIPNDVTLGFISDEERMGKTFLTRFFLPPSMEDYFVIPQANQKIILADLFTRYLVICFDELNGINRGVARIEEFKTFSRSRKILVQRRNDVYAVNRPRIAVTLLTANRNAELGGFLTGDHGTSRYGLVETSKIDKRYSHRVKIDQMWAEMLMLYEESEFDGFFSDHDFKEFTEYNRRYKIDTSEAKYVELFLSQPEESTDEFYWHTASEVIAHLWNSGKLSRGEALTLRPEKMGYALTNAGFTKKDKWDSAKKYPEGKYAIKYNA